MGRMMNRHEFIPVGLTDEASWRASLEGYRISLSDRNILSVLGDESPTVAKERHFRRLIASLVILAAWTSS